MTTVFILPVRLQYGQVDIDTAELLSVYVTTCIYRYIEPHFHQDKY